ESGKTAHSSQNLAQILGPILAARELVLVGEATAEEWAEVERKNQALARAFTVVRVGEPDEAATARILGRVARALAAAHPILVEPPALAEILGLVRRFMPYGAAVGNACAFLRRLVARRIHELAMRANAGDVLAQFSSESGIPRRLLDDREPLDEREVLA